MSRTRNKIRRWVGEKMYFERMARRKDAADPELRIDLGLRDVREVEVSEMSETQLRRTFLWEAGYRGDMENVLGLNASCSCERCGRFLPAVVVESEEWWDVHVPVAHVDHGGLPCRSGS